MKDDIIQKLDNHIAEGIASEAGVVYMMAQTRKLIEHSQMRTQFPYLAFYCNWTLHAKIERERTATSVLERLNEAIERHKRTNDVQVLVSQVSQVISLMKLRSDLESFYSELDINQRVLSDPLAWRTFRKLLIAVLIDLPLRPQIDLSLVRQFAFSQKYGNEVYGTDAGVIAGWVISLNDGQEYSGPVLS